MLAIEISPAGSRIDDAVALLIVLGGIPILRWAGRRNGLQGRGEWMRATGLTLALLFLGLGMVSCLAAMAMYG